jgi:hypothetical protein
MPLEGSNMNLNGTTKSTGIHLSWPAIGVILTVVGLLVGIADRVRSQDMAMMQERVAALQKEVALGRDERLRNQQAIVTALTDQAAIMDRRFTRIEQRVDMILDRCAK